MMRLFGLMLIAAPRAVFPLPESETAGKNHDTAAAEAAAKSKRRLP